MYRQAGTRPNFTDIARRYGMHRHTVAKYWKAGGQVEDARRCRPSGLDRHREVIEAKAQLPGATKRSVYEYLLDRCYAGEEPPAYNTLIKWMRRNGIECGRPAEGPEPHPRFETAPGERMQFDWKESLRMADADGEVFEFNVFSATLGYSRLHRFVYSRTRTEDDVMACLLAVMAANGGLRAGAGAAEEPADQGQGGILEPLPVTAGRLRERPPRRGGARGRHRAHRGPVHTADAAVISCVKNDHNCRNPTHSRRDPEPAP